MGKPKAVDGPRTSSAWAASWFDRENVNLGVGAGRARVFRPRRFYVDAVLTAA